ncbi:MAG: S8 family serine peptidase [Pseudomonadota bacterium]
MTLVARASFNAMLVVGLSALAACQSYQLSPPDDAVIRAEADRVVDPSEIVVLVNSQRAASNLTVNAARRGYRLKDETALAALDLIMITMEIPDGRDGARAIRELEGIEPTATAGVNHAYQVQSTSAPRASVDYGPDLIAWPSDACPAHAKIGVIDAALSPERDAMANVTSKNFAVGQSAASGHADAIVAILTKERLLKALSVYVAGVIGETAAGDEAAGVDGILRGLNWLAGHDVDVVNISLAGPYNKILDRAVQRASDAGMIIVAAAGNTGPASPPRYPAAFKDVIAVTAVDARSNIYERAVRGRHIDVAAPGVDILIQVNNAPRFMSGTSLSAPLVAARIAADPKVKRADGARLVRADVKASVIDIGENGRDDLHGHGLLYLAGRCPSL